MHNGSRISGSNSSIAVQIVRLVATVAAVVMTLISVVAVAAEVAAVLTVIIAAASYNPHQSYVYCNRKSESRCSTALHEAKFAYRFLPIHTFKNSRPGIIASKVFGIIRAFRGDSEGSHLYIFISVMRRGF